MVSEMNILKEFRDGKVMLFQRNDIVSDVIYYRITLPEGSKRYEIRSTKTNNIDKAMAIVSKRVKEIEILSAAGMNISKVGFSEVAKLYMVYMNNAKNSKPSYMRNRRTFDSITVKYLIPFFKNTPVAMVDSAAVTKYHHWREASVGSFGHYTDGSKRLSEVIISRIVNWASHQGYIKKNDVNMRIQTAYELKRRGTFTKEQVSSLLSYLDHEQSMVRNGPKEYSKACMKNLAVVMIYCGLRPHEVFSITWNDLRFEIVDGCRVPILRVDGKTGKRQVVGMKAAASAFDEMKEFRKNALGSDRIFDGPKGICGYIYQFNLALDALGFKLDTNGEKLSLYSLRHYYVTNKLLAGIDIHTISRNCGTSVKQIENHYSHVEPINKMSVLM